MINQSQTTAFFVAMTSESIRQWSLQAALPEEAEQNEKEGQQEWVINGDPLRGQRWQKEGVKNLDRFIINFSALELQGFRTRCSCLCQSA